MTLIGTLWWWQNEFPWALVERDTRLMSGLKQKEASHGPTASREEESPKEGPVDPVLACMPCLPESEVFSLNEMQFI